MANPTITNVDLGVVVAGDSKYRDETFTAPASVVPAGTILARLTADLKLVVFVKGGSLGAEVPVSVLTYEVDGGAGGDVPIRPLIGGTVRKDKLIIAADGDDSNVDNAVLDGLRTFAIFAEDVQELNILDNQ